MQVAYLPSHANFVSIDVGTLGQGRLVAEILGQRGILVRPLDDYDMPGYIRVTVGTKDQNDRFLGELNTLLI